MKGIHKHSNLAMVGAVLVFASLHPQHSICHSVEYPRLRTSFPPSLPSAILSPMGTNELSNFNFSRDLSRRAALTAREARAFIRTLQHNTQIFTDLHRADFLGDNLGEFAPQAVVSLGGTDFSSVYFGSIVAGLRDLPSLAEGDFTFFPSGTLGAAAGLNSLLNGYCLQNGATDLIYDTPPFGSPSVLPLVEILADQQKQKLVVGLSVNFLRVQSSTFADELLVICESFSVNWILLNGRIERLSEQIIASLAASSPSFPNNSLQDTWLVLDSFTLPLTREDTVNLDALRVRFQDTSFPLHLFLVGESREVLNFKISHPLIDTDEFVDVINEKSLPQPFGAIHQGLLLREVRPIKVLRTIPELRLALNSSSEFPKLAGRSLSAISEMNLDEMFVWLSSFAVDAIPTRFLGFLRSLLGSLPVSLATGQLAWSERLVWSLAALRALELSDSCIVLPYIEDDLSPKIGIWVDAAASALSGDNLVISVCEPATGYENTNGVVVASSKNAPAAEGFSCCFPEVLRCGLDLPAEPVSGVWMLGLEGPNRSGKTVLAKEMAYGAVISWPAVLYAKKEQSKFATLVAETAYLSYWPDLFSHKDTLGVVSALLPEISAVASLGLGAFGAAVTSDELVTIPIRPLLRQLGQFVSSSPAMRLLSRCVGDEAVVPWLQGEVTVTPDVIPLTLGTFMSEVPEVVRRVAIICANIPQPMRMELPSTGRRPIEKKVTEQMVRRGRYKHARKRQARAVMVCDHFFEGLSMEERAAIFFALEILPEYGIGVVYTSSKPLVASSAAQVLSVQMTEHGRLGKLIETNKYA